MSRDSGSVFVAMGARLAIVRSEIGLTQTALADALGVSHRAYHSYEKVNADYQLELLLP